METNELNSVTTGSQLRSMLRVAYLQASAQGLRHFDSSNTIMLFQAACSLSKLLSASKQRSGTMERWTGLLGWSQN